MKRTLTAMLVALAPTTSLASADVYTWTGAGADTDWATLGNWEVGGGAATATPTTDADTANFDTTGGLSYTVTGIPAGGRNSQNKINVNMSGNGEITWSGGSIYYGGNWNVTGSVDLTSTGRFYPAAGTTSKEIVWNSTGIFTTLPAEYGMYWNQGNSTIRQQAGTIKIHGGKAFRRSGDKYVVEGGETQSTNLFASEAFAGNSLRLEGGDWTQSGSMALRHSLILLTEGTFKISGGKLTNTIQLDGTGLAIGTADQGGYFDFISGGTAALVTGNSAAEMQAYITAEGIRIDGAAANIGDFSIVENAGVTTVQLVPEPATMSLLALGGIAMLRRRKK